MPLRLVDTVTIGDYWLSALINGDTTGLKDLEADVLDGWVQHYPKATFDVEGESYFGRCKITDLMGSVVDVDIYQWSDV